MVLIGGAEDWTAIQLEKSMWLRKRGIKEVLVTVLIGKDFQ
jgi:hypothetical protein